MCWSWHWLYANMLRSVFAPFGAPRLRSLIAATHGADSPIRSPRPHTLGGFASSLFVAAVRGGRNLVELADGLHGYSCIAGFEESFGGASGTFFQQAFICRAELLDVAALTDLDDGLRKWMTVVVMVNLR